MTGRNQGVQPMAHIYTEGEVDVLAYEFCVEFVEDHHAWQNLAVWADTTGDADCAKALAHMADIRARSLRRLRVLLERS
jgi:hypothetical protein